MNYILPFLAVVLGYLYVSYIKPSQQQYTKLLLSFSGAYLLALTVFVLIPEVYHTHEGEGHNFKYIGLFVILGVLLQIVLEFSLTGQNTDTHNIYCTHNIRQHFRFRYL